MKGGGQIDLTPQEKLPSKSPELLGLRLQENILLHYFISCNFINQSIKFT